MTDLATLLLVVSMLLSIAGATGACVAYAPGQPLSAPFPRLSMWWPNSQTMSLASIARYDLVVLGDWQRSKVASLKALSPGIMLLDSTNACELTFKPSLSASAAENRDLAKVPFPWLLTQVGSALTSGVDAAATTLPVGATTAASGLKLFVPGDTVVIDNELAYVRAVGTNTITVRRGVIRAAAAHLAGTRVAATVSVGLANLMLDLTDKCPKVTVDPAVGPESWAQYNARIGGVLIRGAAWDGIYVDRATGTQSWIVGRPTARSIDYARSNTVPWSYSAFDSAWTAGLRSYEERLRSAVGAGKLIHTNWGYPNFDLLNGNNFEAFPDGSGGAAGGVSWSTAVFGPWTGKGSYFDWLTKTREPHLASIMTFQDSKSSPTDYRRMRFGLATALLGDGFFEYETDGSLALSRSIPWFDEYDGAGLGRGYLGQPLGPAVKAGFALGAWRRDFTGGVALVNPSARAETVDLGGTFRKIKGTQVPSTNDGSLVTSVTVPPKDGLMLVRPAADPPGPVELIPTRLALSASAAAARYGSTVALSATLTVPGGVLPFPMTVRIEKSVNGGASWSADGTATYGSANRRYSARRTIYQTVGYRMRYDGNWTYGQTVSNATLVRVLTRLLAPSVSRVAGARRTYAIHGLVEPRSKGTTRLYLYRKRSGRWRLQRVAGASSKDYRSVTVVTRYWARVRLPAPGTWCVKARHTSADHKRTWSTARIFRVT